MPELDVLLANLKLLLTWPLYQKVDSQALLHILDFGMGLPLQHCLNKKTKAQMSSNKVLDRQVMTQLCNKILYSHKNDVAGPKLMTTLGIPWWSSG